MVPKHLFEGTDMRNSKYANAPIGIGALQVRRVAARAAISASTRFEDYFKPGQPYLDRIVPVSIADSATRTAVLERGEAHLTGFGGVPYSDARELDKLPHLSVTTDGYEMFSPIAWLEFDTRNAPFDKKEVRQAVALRPRSPVDHRQHLVRLRQGRNQPDQLEPAAVPHERRQELQCPGRARDRQPAVGRGGLPAQRQTASASRSRTISRRTARSGSASANT